MKINYNKLIFSYENKEYNIELLGEFSKLPYLFIVEFHPETPLQENLMQKLDDGDLTIRLDENLNIMKDNPIPGEILNLQKTILRKIKRTNGLILPSPNE